MKYTLTAFLGSSLLMYLAGAFVANSMNVGDWDTFGRLIISFIVTVATVFGVVADIDN